MASDSNLGQSTTALPIFKTNLVGKEAATEKEPEESAEVTTGGGGMSNKEKRSSPQSALEEGIANATAFLNSSSLSITLSPNNSPSTAMQRNEENAIDFSVRQRVNPRKRRRHERIQHYHPQENDEFNYYKKSLKSINAPGSGGGEEDGEIIYKNDEEMTSENDSFNLRWPNHVREIWDTFETLWERLAFVDVTLMCEPEIKTSPDELKVIKAHKVVLSASSDFFKKLLEENPCKHATIVLKDFSSWEVETLLCFMYRGYVNVNREKVETILKAGEILQIRGLKNYMSKTGINWDAFENSKEEGKLGQSLNEREKAEDYERKFLQRSSRSNSRSRRHRIPPAANSNNNIEFCHELSIMDQEGSRSPPPPPSRLLNLSMNSVELNCSQRGNQRQIDSSSSSKYHRGGDHEEDGLSDGEHEEMENDDELDEELEGMEDEREMIPQTNKHLQIESSFTTSPLCLLNNNNHRQQQILHQHHYINKSGGNGSSNSNIRENNSSPPPRRKQARPRRRSGSAGDFVVQDLRKTIKDFSPQNNSSLEDDFENQVLDFTKNSPTPNLKGNRGNTPPSGKSHRSSRQNMNLNFNLVGGRACWPFGSSPTNSPLPRSPLLKSELDSENGSPTGMSSTSSPIDLKSTMGNYPGVELFGDIQQQLKNHMPLHLHHSGRDPMMLPLSFKTSPPSPGSFFLGANNPVNSDESNNAGETPQSVYSPVPNLPHGFSLPPLSSASNDMNGNNNTNGTTSWPGLPGLGHSAPIFGRHRAQHSAPRGGPPRSWSNQDLTEALHNVWNKKMTTSQASRIFGIPYNSLLMYVRGKYGKSLKLDLLKKGLDLALENSNKNKNGNNKNSNSPNGNNPSGLDLQQNSGTNCNNNSLNNNGSNNSGTANSNRGEGGNGKSKSIIIPPPLTPPPPHHVSSLGILEPPPGMDHHHRRQHHQHHHRVDRGDRMGVADHLVDISSRFNPLFTAAGAAGLFGDYPPPYPFASALSHILPSDKAFQMRDTDK